MEIKELSYNYIDDYQLIKRCGEHGRLSCRLSINIEEKINYLRMIGNNISFCFNNRCIFFGIIKEVSINTTDINNITELLVISSSIQEDEIAQGRIFQSPDNKYGDILDQDKLELKYCKLVLPELAEIPYKKIALQNHETNFNFIKRLADDANMRLWVDDTQKDAVIYLQKNELIRGSAEIKIEEILSIKYQREYKSSKSIKKAIIVLERYINFGRRVKIEGEREEYVIIGFKVYPKHGIDRFEYELEEIITDTKGIHRKEVNEIAVHLKARVINQDDPEKKGRLQVIFNEEGIKDVNSDHPRWLPLVSPYIGNKSGIVFIPDKGDEVDVIYSEKKCYINAAIRESKIIDEIKQPTEKYIGNNFQQRIFWKEKSLEIISDNNSIYLDKNCIELKVENNRIIVNQDQILLLAGNNKMKLDKEGFLFNVSNSKTNITVSGINAAGSSINIISSGQVNISGSKINLT